jgi:hypothetical protein
MEQKYASLANAKTLQYQQYLVPVVKHTKHHGKQSLDPPKHMFLKVRKPRRE